LADSPFCAGRDASNHSADWRAPAGYRILVGCSLALGYSVMVMMGIQFELTARFRRATAPFGIDIIYYFHRYLAVAALGLIILHVVIVTFANPSASGLINPWTSPWYINIGIAAFLLFALLALSYGTPR